MDNHYTVEDIIARYYESTGELVLDYSDIPDEYIDMLVEEGRHEYRDAWNEYISDFY